VVRRLASDDLISAGDKVVVRFVNAVTLGV
jgi:hypothetical protein